MYHQRWRLVLSWLIILARKQATVLINLPVTWVINVDATIVGRYDRRKFLNYHVIDAGRVMAFARTINRLKALDA